MKMAASVKTGATASGEARSHALLQKQLREPLKKADRADFHQARRNALPHFAVAISLLLFSLGCVSSKSGVDRLTDNWTLGKTTRRDVVQAWGNPDAVLKDVWIWRSRKTAGGKLKASFMMIGATVENRVFSTSEHRLRFGPDGTLADERIVDYTPGQDEWSINPWN